jgi:hypothetical protein
VPTEPSGYIRGRELYEELVKQGVISSDDKIRRVVIDAEVGHPVRLYVDRFGDDRLLKVNWTLGGFEITSVPIEDAE